MLLKDTLRGRVGDLSSGDTSTGVVAILETLLVTLLETWLFLFEVGTEEGSETGSIGTTIWLTWSK